MSKTPKIQICNGEACTQASTQKYVHEWCQEYFNEDDTNWEVCRQSVVLRAQAVEKTGGYFAYFSQRAAEKFP
ncbi:MAG: hypothetical protein DRJ10_08115, partial [Bacteroidetes bacterium]